MGANLRMILLAALLSSASTAASQAQHMNQSNAPCRETGTTPEAVACFHDASEAANRELARKIILVRRVLEPGEKKRLEKVQEIWRRYRDETCGAEQDLYGSGTARWPAYYACMEAEIRQRMVDMEASYGWRLQKWGLE